MAIIQISKIQQRSGNLVDLPELSEAELGWATDERRLFVGRSAPYNPENVEVLTSYSNISFSQIDGSGGGNVFITGATNGQVLSFDGTNWINKGGAVDKLIDLGDVSNVKIGGGAIGYVLETDGTGNLSWSSKGTLRVNIESLSNSTPIVMTVANTTPYTDGLPVTISGVQGNNANTILNGQVFYVKLGVDFPITHDFGNVSLYIDSSLTIPTVGTTLTYTNSNNAIATSLLAGAGSAGAGGSNSSVQFNSAGLFLGDSGFTFNNTGTKLLTVAGNISTGNITVSGNSNLGNAATANYFIGNGSLLTSINGGNVIGEVNFAATANAVAGANVIGVVDSATTAGTVTTAAQPNITSTGTLSSLTVSANTTTGGVKTDNYYYANGVPISFTGTYSNSNVASYLPTFTGTVGATALTTGATATAGIITGNWSLAAGSKLNSTYADLAECYKADAHYEAGTVLEFSGMNEVTLAADSTNRVAGIVSTNPAYVMNSQCEGEYIVQLALQGRAPCKVRGNVRKGDMMVSGGNGFARPSASPLMGTVIGKSLEDFTGTSGVIEVAAGRL